MPSEPAQPLPSRRSIPLPHYDYAQPGAYFLTLVTWDRRMLFGNVVDREMRLNEAGESVRLEWERTPSVRPQVELDVFQIMPNHVHGILILVEKLDGALREASQASGARSAPLRPQRPSQSVGAVVAGFKAAVTRQVILSLGTPGPIWQRNYYERVIRDEAELYRAGEYIRDNPARWSEDANNPARRGGRQRGA